VIYYVRTTGNDTTGDGSAALPWLTLSKAQATVTHGDTVRIGSGTYEESTAGAGYFNINRTFTDWVTFESETGVAADVVIRGAANATYNTLTGAANAYYRFRQVTFGSRLSTNTSAVRISQTARLSFLGCRFVAPTDPGSQRYGLQATTSGAVAINYLTLDGCTATVGGNTNARAIVIEGVQSTGGSVSASVVRACTAMGSLGALYLSGVVTGFEVDGGTFTGTGAYGVQVGQDSHTAIGTLTGSIRDATITTATGTGHGLLIGAGASAIQITGCTVNGADYAIVLKESAGHAVSGCTAEGGFVHATNGSALYCKAAVGCLIDTCTLTTRTGTHGVVRVGVGDTGNKSGTITVTNTRINAYGVPAYEWADSSGDSGGGVVDRNTFELTGAGTFGSVYGTAGITTFNGLRTAWSTYGDGSNDANSTVYVAPPTPSPVVPAETALTQTVRDLITRALRLLGVLGEGERISSGQASDALLTFQTWIDALRAESLSLATLTRSTHSLAAQSSYTVGPGGDLNIVYPAYLDRVALIDAAVTPTSERPLGMFTDASWANLPQKALTATEPHSVYYSPGFPLGTLHVYPVPTAAIQLALYAPGSPLTSVASLDTVISVPPGWARMLVSNLAVELAEEYGKPVSPTLLERASESKAAVKRSNTRIPPRIGIYGEQYDIHSDRIFVR